MSVVEEDKVDGIAITNNEKKLMLLISDHLDWAEEYDHLIQLQKKINAYIGFIESKQFESIYPNKHFSSFGIEIHFKYEFTENCNKFIDSINKQLSDNCISVETIILA